MASFFGRSKKKAAEDASAEAYAASIKSVHGALGKLHNAIDKLDKRQALLEKRVAGIIVEARTKLQAKDKEGAKLCIKRKALWAKQLGVGTCWSGAATHLRGPPLFCEGRHSSARAATL